MFLLNKVVDFNEIVNDLKTSSQTLVKRRKANNLSIVSYVKGYKDDNNDNIHWMRSVIIDETTKAVLCISPPKCRRLPNGFDPTSQPVSLTIKEKSDD